jgi:hypothetical protein
MYGSERVDPALPYSDQGGLADLDILENTGSRNQPMGRV